MDFWKNKYHFIFASIIILEIFVLIMIYLKKYKQKKLDE